MALSFQDQLIYITGAASGIGRATAIKLAAQGAELALFDIAELKPVAIECQRVSGREHHYGYLDVSGHHGVDEVLSNFSGGRKVNHVFNCAGINPTLSELTETNEKYFDKLFSVNIKGYYNVTRAMIPHMASGGSFVNVGSICGLHPQRYMAIYCATKYAVTGFSKSMALELGPKGIRVNVVAPGFIDTPTNSSVVAGQEVVEKTGEKVAMRRMGTAAEVADVAIFLMSDGARYMNGSVVEVNGGTG